MLRKEDAWKKFNDMDMPEDEKIYLWGHACGKAWARHHTGIEPMRLPSDEDEDEVSVTEVFEVPEYGNRMRLGGMGLDTAVVLISDAVFDRDACGFWEDAFLFSDNGPDTAMRLITFYHGFCDGVGEIVTPSPRWEHN
jgi:hypothetical protein